MLVLANFGGPRSCASTACRSGECSRPATDAPTPAGSCIVVVATDAPLSPRQLERVARRAGLGLARTGSVAHHGSGEIFLAFATGDARSVPDGELDPLFAATVDATEEAVLNALWAAEDVTGRDGRSSGRCRTTRARAAAQQAQRLPGRGR